MIVAGTISDQSELKFDHAVWVDTALGWYRFDDEASRQRLTEADILAVFALDAEQQGYQFLTRITCGFLTSHFYAI